VSYRALKRQFDLDDSYICDLKDEILYTQSEVDEDEDRGLVWTGASIKREIGISSETDTETRFHTALSAVMWWLQRDRRITYRTLKHLLSLDETLLTEIRNELALRGLAVDEQGQVLVWTGENLPMSPAVADDPSYSAPPAVASSDLPTPSSLTAAPLPANGPITPEKTIIPDVESDLPSASVASARTVPEAERRQLTVMFCDLVGSTDLSGKFDPEHLREVVRAYQETAAEVIQRYEGHIAQYLGDGLLIYFGFPIAHEDDAQRAVYTGLEICEAMAGLNRRLQTGYGVELAVRIGVHTGPVVIGEMGGGDRHENLALGETPNIAARLEGLSQSGTVLLSDVTARLVRGVFVLEELGLKRLKGVAEAIPVYQVLRPLEVDGDEDATTPVNVSLVGRDEEVGLLIRRWEQAKEGLGQVVLISGEAGRRWLKPCAPRHDTRGTPALSSVVRPTISTALSIPTQCKAILSRQYMKSIIAYTVKKDRNGIPQLEYEIAYDAINQVSDTYLGKTMIVTDRQSWDNEQIILAYRSQFHIENVFKEMKDRDIGSWWPLYHWTDDKINVHSFYCTIAVLLRALTHRRVKAAGIDISMKRLLAELEEIKEVIVLYPRKRGAKTDPQHTVLSKTSELQQSLLSILDVKPEETVPLG
jgi:class 3 adenylate cyclase